jgi:hypothetical protein
MRRRGSGRFALALTFVIVLAQLGFPKVVTLGAHGGVAGAAGTLVVAGFALALIFTAIYDGPRSLARVLRRA